MTDSDLVQAINDIFVDCFEIPPETIKPKSEIFADLGLDSLDIVDLVAEIQKRFKLQVRNDERVRSIRTMQNLYDYMKLVLPAP